MQNYLMNELVKYADKLLAGAAIVAVASVLAYVLKRIIRKLLKTRHLAPIMAGRLNLLLRSLIVVVAALLLMQTIGIFDSAWAVISATLAALAVGFVAAWSMLSNITAALLVLTFRPFRIGDSVELVDLGGDSLGGRVVDMNLMFTTLAAPDNDTGTGRTAQLLQVPNSLFFQKVLRTRSPAQTDSDATFFAKSKN